MGHVVLLLLLALLLITSTHGSTAGHAAAITEAKQGAVESLRAMRSTVGSRPPSCEGRCRSCVRCEAVQVPVTPQEELQKKKRRSSSGGSNINGGGGGGGGGGLRRTRTAALLPSSYDDHSNYKALSWRCKCGGMPLNP